MTAAAEIANPRSQRCLRPQPKVASSLQRRPEEAAGRRLVCISYFRCACSESSRDARQRGSSGSEREQTLKRIVQTVDIAVDAQSADHSNEHPMNTPIGGDRDSSTNAMAKLAERRRNTMARLASGKRIHSAADDASGLAMAQRLHAEVRSAAQTERNYEDGRSITRVADGALQGSNDTLTRMRELAVQARNGTLSDGDRANVQQEFDQLAGQLDQTAGAPRFAGRQLLDGSAAGANAIEITDGEGGSTRLEFADAGAAALGVAGREVADPATLKALDDAGAMLASERARVGASDSTLERQGAVVAAERLAADAARSRIEDADVAKELAEELRDRILAKLQVAGQRIARQSGRRLIDDLM